MRKIILLSLLVVACTTRPSMPDPDAPTVAPDSSNDAGIDPDAPTLIDGPLGTPGMCDVITQQGCATGQGCYPSVPANLNPLGHCEVIQSGGGGQGNGCTQDNQCATGFVCLKNNVFKCTAICTSDATCPSSMPTCAMYGHGEYGQCVCTTGTCN